MEKILNWIKKHKVPLIAGAVVVVLLAAAFWYGSGTPDSKGFSAAKKQEASDAQRSGQDKKTEKTSKETVSETTGEAVLADSKEPAEVLMDQGQESENQKTATNENVSSSGGAGAAEDKSKNTDSNKRGGISQSSQTENGQSTAAVGAQINSNTGTMVINPDTGKDQYQTDPVPAGKPEPVEPEHTETGEKKYSCTISISCATILDNMELLDKKKVSLIPKDGWILKPVTVSFQEGESVFDVLQRVCKEKKIHMEFSNTPMYNSAYIEGIHNIYEFDVGSLSGWNYKVNDWFPNYGCSRYQLKDGDVINWMYTCNLGKDIGGSNATGQ